MPSENAKSSSKDIHKVSVIIPAYNAEDYIGKCLDSVLNQTLKEIEIICVDDGSEDKTGQILEEYKKKDNRVQVVKKVHSNTGDSRNAGMKAAKGEYLSFVDADDFIEPDMLETAYGLAVEQGSDIVHFKTDIYDHERGTYTDAPWTLRTWEMPEKRPFSAEDAADKIFNMGSCTPGDKLFKKCFIDENNIQFQNISSTDDMLFTFGALSLAGVISIAEKVLYHMRTGHRKYLSEGAETMTSNYFKALMELKSFLEERGIYEKYRKSFLNWAADFSLWNYNRIKEPFFSELIRQQLKNSYFRKLGIYGLDKNDYYNKDWYLQVRDLKRALSEEMKEKIPSIPKVSVVIPFCNTGGKAGECLEKYTLQTLKSIEIICVDDCSDDDTADCLEAFANEDPRIRVIRNKERLGHGKSMNTGLDAAKGMYVCFSEEYDYADVTMLRKLYEACKENDLDIARGDLCKFRHDKYGDKIYDHRRVVSDDYYNRVIDTSLDRTWRHFINVPWGGIYKMSFLKKNNLRFYEEEDTHYIDGRFVIDANMRAKRVMFIPETVYYENMKSYLFSGFDMTMML